MNLASLLPSRKPAGLRLQTVTGNLTRTADGTVTAWYELPERVWAYRPDADREVFLEAVAGQYAALAGSWLHLRRTTRPYPTGAWAASLLRSAHRIDHGALADHLRTAADHVDSHDPAEGLTLLGVTVPAAGLSLRGLLHKAPDDLDERVRKISDLLAPFGLGAEPATPTTLAWLLYRSVGLGLTPPDRRHTALGPDDMLALTEHVERFPTRYGATVRHVNRQRGEEVYVAALTVGRMEDLEIPERHDPWLHLADQVPFPVELSSRVRILGPNAVTPSLTRRLLMIRSQQKDFGEHGLDSPPELARLAQRALTVGDEIATGRPVDATRAHGWHRLAVAAPTEKECLARVAELGDLYERHARIALQHPKDQPRIIAEFIPGEPTADTGYVRRLPVQLWAAAVPQATAAVGDGRGDLIGWVSGTGCRPVMFDPHFPTEVRERSGLAVLVAEPGGGKSTLMGAVAYLAALRGVQTTILDPSGPLAALARMPQLRGRTRVIDLVGTERGTLAPYALVPTPRATDWAGDRRGWEMAVANARAERKALVLDVCLMLLPSQVTRRDDAVVALREAVRQVRADETSTLDDVGAQLEKLGHDGDIAAKTVAGLLADAADLPLAQLFFGQPPAHLVGDDAVLTVITMAGLQLPDLSIDRDYWSVEESLAVPMLHLAHRLAARRCYGGDMHTRKLVALDEAHFMHGWASGRSFLVRLARDSRKWNLAALVASQNPKDILGLDVQNLVSTVFAGRVADDVEVAAEALRLLRVPATDRYAHELAALSATDPMSRERLGYREFVMRDCDGRIQKIRVDVSWVPGLRKALDTTPTGGLR